VVSLPVSPIPYEQAPSVMGGARFVRLWEILRRLDAKRHGPPPPGKICRPNESNSRQARHP